MGMIGIISGIVKNLRTGDSITDFGTAIDETAKERCCGPDCCDGVYYWKDVVDGTKHVTYVKGGVLTTATQAVYDADKANGFV